MKTQFLKKASPLALILGAMFAAQAHGTVFVQCPNVPNAVCKHLAAGDGFATMADGKVLYTFGFSEVPSSVAASDVMTASSLAANIPGPTINVKEGDQFYLSLSNVGMVMRPDLFDAHTVHFHGFPNAAPVFDGEPESTFGINMGSTLTYFYNVVEPGTFLYHCHVEAAEHMQMGMLGNLYVDPKQNGTAYTFQGKSYSKFVYNDGDGSTGYDVSYPIQLSSMDSAFHDLHVGVQPLPFADMNDNYAMLNGRGYPDTVNPLDLAPSLDDQGAARKVSQKIPSLVTATQNQRILLRVSNVSITEYFTVTALGLPMKVVGSGAHILRGPSGKDLSYDTASVTLGGGETADVMIDTTGVPAGTYFLYTTNLNYLSNGNEDFGGMMTEIVIQ
ncbi:MAG: multicopper oxidase domain-containing protein [Gammaproteobacteria bacterium]|nr:multicopper oxidase domain-containing protein [Gammaproteobacteria bacterium]